MATSEPTGQSTDGGESESQGYRIYVELPADGDEEAVRNALHEFARLLEDPEKGITVVVYGDEEIDEESGQKRVAYSAATEPKPLYPAYVCHNRL
jgi:hypothetical protein